MLIVFEGIDGAGKNTQTGLLTQRVACEGLSSAVFSFPRYGLNPFARAISRYLNGDFGSLEQVAPEMAALLYAGDRFTTRDELHEAVEENDIVICDRYVSSNLAHQAAKLAEDKREALMKWILEIEYQAYGLPKPDLTLFLDVPVGVSQKLIQERGKRVYTEMQADIHERAQDYLATCREVFLHMAEQHIGGRWARVVCTGSDGHLLSADAIGNEIWNAIRPLVLQQPAR